MLLERLARGCGHAAGIGPGVGPHPSSRVGALKMFANRRRSRRGLAISFRWRRGLTSPTQLRCCHPAVRCLAVLGVAWP